MIEVCFIFQNVKAKHTYVRILTCLYEIAECMTNLIQIVKTRNMCYRTYLRLLMLQILSGVRKLYFSEIMSA